MKEIKPTATRILYYVVGLFFLAIAVNLAIGSNLGISPVNSLPYAMSVATGVRMGVCVSSVFAVFVALQMLLLGRAFQVKNLLQLVFATLFGYFVDKTAFLVEGLTPSFYLSRLGVLGVSILCVAVGLTFYLTGDIVPLPSEGLVLALTTKLKTCPFHWVKMVLDCSYVCLAGGIVLLAVGELAGVGVGTVISAVVTGKVFALISNALKPRLSNILVRQAVASNRPGL